MQLQNGYSYKVSSGKVFFKMQKNKLRNQPETITQILGLYKCTDLFGLLPGSIF